jgi:hypothetical protein
LVALGFSFSAESLGPILITSFSDHSHEARIFHEDGKLRLKLVHDHEEMSFDAGSSATEHPDHEIQFMDQEAPFLLPGKTNSFTFPNVAQAFVSLHRLFPNASTKPIFDPPKSRPHPMLMQVRSVRLLV